MEVRITKLRVAMAALFVLAGVGLASLLSPLVGTALATVGPGRRISPTTRLRPSSPRSTPTGKLAVGDGAGPLSVDGTVTARPAAPASPWRVSIDIQAAATSSPGRARRRSTSPACPISTDAASGNGVDVILLRRTTFRAAPRIAPARLRRRALADPRRGRRRDAALVHLPDAACNGSHPQTRKRACSRAAAHELHHDDERRRLLRRLTTRNRAGVPERVRLLALNGGSSSRLAFKPGASLCGRERYCDSLEADGEWA